MFTIFKKEINSYFNSLIAYIVIVVFLLLSGVVTWFYTETNVLDFGFADLNALFTIAPLLFFLFVPAISMRLFSEEYRNGTIELLFTKPINDWQIIFGKFFAAWLLVGLALVPTLVYYFSIYQLGNPQGNIDSAAVVGSYIGLLLLAGVFVALCLLMSASTDNQVVAFVLGASSCYFLFDGLHQIAALFRGGTQYFIDFLSLRFHYDALSRGVLALPNIIYFISIAFFALFLTKQLLQKRKK